MMKSSKFCQRRLQTESAEMISPKLSGLKRRIPNGTKRRKVVARRREETLFRSFPFFR